MRFYDFYFGKQQPGYVARKYGAERSDWDAGIGETLDVYQFMMANDFHKRVGLLEGRIREDTSAKS